jgi:hypothetical protein
MAMTMRLSILFLVAMACLACSRDRHPSATQEATGRTCELTQDDYALFGMLLNEFRRPDGKEMLIINVTATPDKFLETQANSRLRSDSSAAPDTFGDYAEKAHSACPVKPEFGDPNSYKVIERNEVDNFFKNGFSGWQEFYKKYPKSSGYWEFSRPGYNATRDEALLYVDHYCGGDCGTGYLYVLSKQRGKWTVKHHLMLWIS